MIIGVVDYGFVVVDDDFVVGLIATIDSAIVVALVQQPTHQGRLPS